MILWDAIGVASYFYDQGWVTNQKSVNIIERDKTIWRNRIAVGIKIKIINSNDFSNPGFW